MDERQSAYRAVGLTALLVLAIIGGFFWGGKQLGGAMLLITLVIWGWIGACKSQDAEMRELLAPWLIEKDKD